MYKRLAVFIAALMFWSSTLANASDRPRSEANRIFDAAESTSAKGKASATAASLRLSKLKPLADADPRVKYAFLLGLIHCGKPKEALDYASNLVGSNPEYVPARRIHVRLLLKNRAFAEALAELEAIGQRVAKEQTATGLSLDVESSCRLLGLAFGYIEGPAKPLVKETLGAGIKQRLLKQLSQECRKPFDEQYQLVQSEHNELVTKGEKAFEELRAKNQAVSQTSDKQRAALAAEQQKVEAQLDQEKARLRAAWDAANSQYAKAGESVATMRAEMLSLSNQRALAAGQLATLGRPVPDKDGRVDPTSLRIYNQRYTSLHSTVSQIDQQYARNQAELERAWQQGVTLETQLTSLIQEGERLGERFQLQKQDFASAGKKIRAAPKSKKPPAIKQRAQSFATYDDFSFALEKQRLLDSLPPSP